MPQIRLRDYEEDLSSFNHNIINLGIHKPGRFCGYDAIVPTGNLTFDLQHDGDGRGLILKNEVNDSMGPLGVLMTTQGLIVVEDQKIVGLTIDTNSGNLNQRIDLIVCNHQFFNIGGGQAATYTILKGSTTASVPPALDNADFQVIVGRLYIPANAVIMDGVKYVKEKCPDSGDSPDARLNEVNNFTKLNSFKQSTGNYLSPASIELGISLWDFPPDGNCFLVRPTADVNLDAIRFLDIEVQNGTNVDIFINDKVTIRQTSPLSQGMLDRGYRLVRFDSNLTNTIQLIGGNNVSVIKPILGQTWMVSLIKVDDVWIIKYIQGLGFGNGFKKGMVIDVNMSEADVILNFNNTGLGINLYTGWAITNGNNGTTDDRGRFSMMATEVPSDGSDPLFMSDLSGNILRVAMGLSGGNAYHKNTMEELVPHDHALPQDTGGTQDIQSVTNTPNSDEGYTSTGSRTDKTGGGNPYDIRPPFVTRLRIQKL